MPMHQPMYHQQTAMYTQQPNVLPVAPYQQPVQQVNYQLSIADSKLLDTVFASRLFEALHLTTFSEDELQDRFKKISGDDSRDWITRSELEDFITGSMLEHNGVQKEDVAVNVDNILQKFDDNQDGH